MFTDADLESDFGPSRKADYLLKLHRLQQETGYCDEPGDHRNSQMIPLGISEQGPPPSDIPFRTGEER